MIFKNGLRSKSPPNYFQEAVTTIQSDRQMLKKSRSGQNIQLDKTAPLNKTQNKIILPKLNRKQQYLDSVVPPQQPQKIQTDQDTMAQITKMSDAIYILGPLSNELINFIEKKQSIDRETQHMIGELRTNEFLKIQSGRFNKIQNFYQKFIIDILMQGHQQKEGMVEIGNIFRKEIRSLFEHYEKFVQNYEDVLKRQNLFQEKEIILIDDFHDGLRLIIEGYNYMYKELDLYGKTKPELEVFVKSIANFKSSLKVNKQNQRASDLVDELEILLKTQFDKLETQQNIIEKLLRENNQLTQIYTDLRNEKTEWEQTKTQLMKGRNDSDLSVGDRELMQKYGIIKKQGDGTSINSSHIIALEDFYMRQVKSLKDELYLAESNLQVAHLKLQNYQNLTKDQERQKAQSQDATQVEREKHEKIEKLKNLSRQDQAVQCVFMKEFNPVSKQDISFSTIITNPFVHFKQNQQELSNNFMISAINIIYSDKIYSDFQDELDQRVRPSMRDFLCTWFLSKYGCKEIAEALFVDFVFTLKSYQGNSLRYQLFVEICQLDDLLKSEQTSIQINSLGINRASFRKIFMGTSLAQKTIMRAGFMHKISGQTFFGTQQFNALMPSILLRGADLISYETASKIIEGLLEQLNLRSSTQGGSTSQNVEQGGDTFNLESHYRKVLAKDMNERARDKMKIYNQYTEEDEDQYIRFDYFVNSLIEIVIKEKLFDLETLYTQIMIKAKQSQEQTITYEDFKQKVQKSFPKKSERWIQIAYKELIDGILTEKTPLNVSILRIIHNLCEEDCLQTNILKIKTKMFMPDYNHQEEPEIIVNATKSQLLRQSKPTNNEGNSSQIMDINQGSRNASIMNTSQHTLGTKSPHHPSTNQSKAVTQNSKRQDSIMHNIAEKKNQLTFEQEMEIEKEKLLQIYDHASEIVLLIESYKILKPIIEKREKRNDQQIIRLHNIFLEDFNKLPQDIFQKQTYDELQSKNKLELKTHISNLWESFRNLTIISLRAN